MGRRGTIDAATGARLLAAYQAKPDYGAAAAACGVPYGPAYRFLKRVPSAVAPALATQTQVVALAGAALWDARGALEENYRRCLDLLSDAEALDPASARAVAARAGVLREIRAHVESGLALARLLIDVEEVRAFQRAVLAAIGEADGPTRDRIVSRLRERRAADLVVG